MKRLSLLLGVLGLFTLGCPARREAAETTTTATTAATQTAPATTAAPTTAPPPVDTVIPIDRTRFLEKAAIGSAVGADGMVTTEVTSFRRGQTIHATVRASEVPQGLAARVVWFDAKNKEISSESKPVPVDTRTVAFQARNTRRWQPGKYRVELWLGGDTVYEQEFNLRR